ncbi:MAG TPA: HD domain-containing phosphohydrolase [Roseiflexaceae bacterium]|nr:HD domain-containing phosphohydrolase [Roseiflexaceae bacterium]
MIAANGTPAAPQRLLVVEDDPIVRDFCERLLRMKGYQVRVAENGRAALERMRETRFDLLLTDLQMPEMGGIALLQEVQQRYPGTDAVVFTAFATVETAREALKLGAFDYLTKPVSVDDLERTVRRALEWRRIRQEKQRLSEIVALYEISQTFTSTLDTATAVREIVQLLWRRFAPRALSLSLFHPEDDELELLAQIGAARATPPGARVAVGGADEAAIMKAHGELAGGESVASPQHLAALVLRTNDRPVGVLRLSRAADQPGFDADDRTLLAICASQIAASLDNSRLYQQLKDQNLQTIAALAAAIDARDPYTRGHSEQVMRYAVRAAELLGLTPQQVERIRYAALLHDIGKIGIRDNILLKPGPLSPEEFDVMRSHPTIGADIVRGIKDLRSIIPIIEHHHERTDGHGYPDGLVGSAIDPEARILAIADAYDTMTSDRAYRRAMWPEEAFAELRKGSGTQWDAHFVEVFIRMIQTEGPELRIADSRRAQITLTDLLARSGSRE